jgi:hypothetical protein
MLGNDAADLRLCWHALEIDLNWGFHSVTTLFYDAKKIARARPRFIDMAQAAC